MAPCYQVSEVAVTEFRPRVGGRVGVSSVFAEQWRAGLAWLPDYSRQVKALHSLAHSSLRKP